MGFHPAQNQKVTTMLFSLINVLDSNLLVLPYIIEGQKIAKRFSDLPAQTHK